MTSIDKRVKKRLADIKLNPTIGKSEEELDAYIKKRLKEK